jgi:Uma2 family endonuclease
LYELFNGELIPVPPESGENVEIAGALFFELLGRKRVRSHRLELEVRGEPKNRYLDLTVLQEEHIDLLKPRNTIRLTMLPPLLVVEVVSPGAIQRERDYIAKRPLAGNSKRSQYQDLCINEYWIFNPQDQEMTVLTMTETGYQEVGVFRGEEAIVSPCFPDLLLHVGEVFA